MKEKIENNLRANVANSDAGSVKIRLSAII